jgi:RNA polymerase sigma factor (sigma-70 family)
MNKKVSETMKINHKILCDLIELKEIKNKTKNKVDCRKYNIAFNKAMSKFGYIIDIHSNKYKSYPNYQDIYQEGRIGLACALDKFVPERSKNFFKLANWYVKTRVKRGANKHSEVKIPITYPGKIIINRINDFDFIENKETPFDCVEKEDDIIKIRKAVNDLEEPNKTIVSLYYGIQNENDVKIKRMTISKISKMLKVEKEEIEEILKESYEYLASNNLFR